MTRDEAKQALAQMRPTLLKVAGRILRASGVGAEDAVHEAYLKAMRTIEAGSFPQQPNHLLAWFTRVVHNTAYDGLRGLSRRKERTAGNTEREPPDSGPGPLEQLVEHEDVAWSDKHLARLPDVISRLPEDRRRMVELRFQGMTNQKIALALGIPQGSVSALFRSVYQELKSALEQGTAP
jgi:RNA polymerase sigma factor (sigma-70 family)